jgi:hypothetical protein
MFRSLRHEFDPLDREILERAFCDAWTTIKKGEDFADINSDQRLATMLRDKLIQMAHSTTLNDDAETLRDKLLDGLHGPVL